MSALPARLARLASAIAVIFIRESAALFPAAATFASAVPAAIAAPVAAAITIEPSAASATRTGRCGLRTGLIHFQIAPSDFFSIETCNRLGRFGIIGHLDKSEAASSSCLPIHCNVNPRNLSKRLEQRTQIRLCRLKTHVANKQILHVLLAFDL